MLSTFEEVVWYTTIPLVALFAHREYTYEFSTPKYAILCVSAVLIGIYLFYKLLKRKEMKFFATPVHWAWLTFALVSLLSTINTYKDNQFFFRQAIDIGLYLFLNVLISFYLSSIVNKKDQIIRFLFLFVLTGLFISINAILNFYFGFDIFLGEVGEPFVRGTIKANIGNVIFVSNYLNMLLPIALYFVISLDIGVLNTKSVWKIEMFKILSLISAILYFTVIVFSQTRSEYLAIILEFLLLILAYLFYIRKREDKIARDLETKAPKVLKRLILFRKVAVTLFIVSAIFVVVVYNTPTVFNNYGEFSMTDRFNAMTSVSSRDERFLSWFSTIYIWKNHKLLGQGIGTYQVYGLYGISDLIGRHPQYNYGWNNFKRAHNDYLQVLSETGIIGLLSIIAMLILLVLYVIRNIRKIEGKDDTILFSMLVLSGIIFAFQSFFSFPGHLLPNALLANVVISVGLGRYFNKVNGKEYTLRRSKAVVIGFVLLLSISLSTYLRWNHFISEVYFRYGNVAYNTLTALRDEQNKVDYYLKQIEAIENDLNNFSGQFEQLSPTNWHKIKQAEAQKLGIGYNQTQAEAERQKYISNIKKQIDTQKKYLLEQQKNLPDQIREQYEIAKYNFLRSIKLNHTYGKSHFYLASLSVDPLRIEELRNLLNKNLKALLSQNADEIQSMIPQRFKYTYYDILNDYIKKNPDFLEKVDMASIQALIDSVSLYELSLQTFTERNTFRALAMRYNSLYQLNQIILDNIKDSDLERKLSGYLSIFFNKYGTWVRRTIDIMPGGWNRFPDWKNPDIELASSGQDIYKYFANVTVRTLDPVNVESRDLLTDLARREIEVCKFMELKGVWGVPDGILDHLHALAREYQTISEYQESIYTYQQILEWYKESYESLSQKANDVKLVEAEYNKFVEAVKDKFDDVLASDEKGYLSNSLTPIFVDKLKRIFERFIAQDFVKIEKDYIDELSKYPPKLWDGLKKVSVWKTFASNGMKDLKNQIVALAFSEKAQKQIEDILNSVVDYQQMLIYERYLRFTSHYEMIKKEFIQTVNNLVNTYKNGSEEKILSDWSEVTFNAPTYTSKEEVMKYLEGLIEKYK